MVSDRPVVMGTKHVVAAGHYMAAHAGFEILEAGGNAVAVESMTRDGQDLTAREAGH